MIKGAGVPWDKKKKRGEIKKLQEKKNS